MNLQAITHKTAEQ